jgi:ankyrin repeat protein
VKKGPPGEITKAVFRSDVEYLRKNLSSENIEERDEDGRTPLMQACIDRKGEIAKLLIDRGASIDATDYQMWTPLHFSVQEGSSEIAEKLLKCGCRVDPEDENGNTPLWRAVFDFNGDLKVIQALLNHGANKGHKNKHGVSIKELVQDDKRLSQDMGS